MTDPLDQVLTVAQMLAAEQVLIDAGTTVEALMQRAGQGAADWVWRVAAGHDVTVLCGPGNNGGDGYVIAEALRVRGGNVAVIVASEPRSTAAKEARALYRGEVLGPDDRRHGEVLVDCLYGSGSRPLDPGDAAMLSRLAARHRHCIALDLPSGVSADTGAVLTAKPPTFDLTIVLGAWKQAHFLMPACSVMGDLRLVPIGIEAVAGAARVIARPRFSAPSASSHKYRRGLLAVVGGAMPGAALLAARAAQAAGAGYVKLLAGNDASPAEASPPPAELVVDRRPLGEALSDHRIAALLIGPGLGRDDAARERLAAVLAQSPPRVLDADALMLLESGRIDPHTSATIATPHEGELAALEQAFGTSRVGSKSDRTLALARTSGMVIVAKGPDTLVAAPDGRLAFAPRASTWLSTAGTGDVLAGVIASRLATGAKPFDAACQGVWLHGEAARHTPPPFTAADLAGSVPAAFAACL